MNKNKKGINFQNFMNKHAKIQVQHKSFFFPKNKSDSLCLKSVESLNCFLQCQSVLSRGCLLFYHGTKHLRVLYIILLLGLLNLIQLFQMESRGGGDAPLAPPLVSCIKIEKFKCFETVVGCSCEFVYWIAFRVKGFELDL